MSPRPTVTAQPDSGPRPSVWRDRSLAAVLPVTSVAPALGGLGTPLRVAVAVAVAVVVLREPARPRPLQVGLLTLLVLVLTADAIGAPTAAYGVVRLLNWLMFVPLALLHVDARTVRLLGVSLLVTCWVQMVGVALQLVGAFRGTWGGLVVSGSAADPADRTLLTRYTGFVGNPNDLGLLLGLGLVVCLVGLVTRAYGRRLVHLSSLAAFTWGLFLTGSRGAILGLVVGVLVVVVLLRPRHATRVAVAGVLIGSVPALTSDGVRHVLASIGAIGAGQDASAASRSSLWRDQLRVNDQWLFGNGFGGYVGGPVTAGTTTGTLDNAWLKLLLEAGVVGCALLALLILSFAVPVLRSRRSLGPVPSVTALVVLAALAMLVWRSLSADLLDVNPWNAVLWMLLGLAAAHARADQPAPGRPGLPVAPWESVSSPSGALSSVSRGGAR